MKDCQRHHILLKYGSQQNNGMGYSHSACNSEVVSSVGRGGFPAQGLSGRYGMFPDTPVIKGMRPWWTAESQRMEEERRLAKPLDRGKPGSKAEEELWQLPGSSIKHTQDHTTHPKHLNPNHNLKPLHLNSRPNAHPSEGP